MEERVHVRLVHQACSRVTLEIHRIPPGSVPGPPAKMGHGGLSVTANPKNTFAVMVRTEGNRDNRAPSKYRASGRVEGIPKCNASDNFAVAPGGESQM